MDAANELPAGSCLTLIQEAAPGACLAAAPLVALHRTRAISGADRRDHTVANGTPPPTGKDTFPDMGSNF